MQHQQQARSFRYYLNRRNSSEGNLPRRSLTKNASRRSEDFDKFLSCMSLKSTESESLIAVPTPKKGHTRNFITNNHTEVNRMSDIYMKPQNPFDIESSEKTISSLKNMNFFALGTIFALFIFFIVIHKKE